MKKVITYLLAMALGFGLGFLTFGLEDESTFVLTLGEVGQMSPEELYKFLASDKCEKVSEQTIECDF